MHISTILLVEVIICNYAEILKKFMKNYYAGLKSIILLCKSSMSRIDVLIIEIFCLETKKQSHWE